MSNIISRTYLRLTSPLTLHRTLLVRRSKDFKVNEADIIDAEYTVVDRPSLLGVMFGCTLLWVLIMMVRSELWMLGVLS